MFWKSKNSSQQFYDDFKEEQSVFSELFFFVIPFMRLLRLLQESVFLLLTAFGWTNIFSRLALVRAALAALRVLEELLFILGQ